MDEQHLYAIGILSRFRLSASLITPRFEWLYAFVSMSSSDHVRNEVSGRSHSRFQRLCVRSAKYNQGTKSRADQRTNYASERRVAAHDLHDVLRCGELWTRIGSVNFEIHIHRHEDSFVTVRRGTWLLVVIPTPDHKRQALLL